MSLRRPYEFRDRALRLEQMARETTLRWLSYTDKRALLVVSRDEFILWARSSGPALKTGAFFRTSTGPIAIPATSLAAQSLSAEKHVTKEHDKGVWFPEPLTEMTVLSEQYDFAISLLLLPNDPPPFEERLKAQHPSSGW
jgi:hypothetical protein